MSSKSLALLSALISLLLLSGCGQVQALVPRIPAPDADYLYFDEFSNKHSGWNSITAEEGMTDYQDGGYVIRVEKTDLDLWGTAGQYFDDVSLEVDATRLNGPENNDFGLLCRAEDNLNFYFGTVASDGYYAIGKMEDGSPQLLTGDVMKITDKVLAGSKTNHLRLDCVDTTISLYANGYQLAQVSDDAYFSGDVGVIAGTLNAPGTEIAFDNFAVFKP